MIRIACPHCTSVIKAPDHAAGRTVGCPKCKKALIVPDHSTAPDDAPTGQERQPAPASATTATPRRADPPVDAGLLEDEPDDRLARSHGRKRRAGGKRSPVLFLLLGFVVVLVLGISCCGIGAAIYFLVPGESPDAAYMKIISYAENGQYDKLWDRIDKKAQAKLELALSAMSSMAGVLGKNNPEFDKFKNLKGKDLFVQLMKQNAQMRAEYTNQKVKSYTVNGDKATLTVSGQKDGREITRPVTMVKEDGVWKLSEN